jgi:hypothetical protein
MKTQCDFCELGTPFLDSIELNFGRNLVKVYPRIQRKDIQGQWDVCSLYKTGDFQYISLSNRAVRNEWVWETSLLKLNDKSKLTLSVLYRVIRTF